VQCPKCCAGGEGLCVACLAIVDQRRRVGQPERLI